MNYLKFKKKKILIIMTAVAFLTDAPLRAFAVEVNTMEQATIQQELPIPNIQNNAINTDDVIISTGTKYFTSSQVGYSSLGEDKPVKEQVILIFNDRQPKGTRELVVDDNTIVRATFDPLDKRNIKLEGLKAGQTVLSLYDNVNGKRIRIGAARISVKAPVFLRDTYAFGRTPGDFEFYLGEHHSVRMENRNADADYIFEVDKEGLTVPTLNSSNNSSWLSLKADKVGDYVLKVKEVIGDKERITQTVNIKVVDVAKERNRVKTTYTFYTAYAYGKTSYQSKNLCNIITYFNQDGKYWFELADGTDILIPSSTMDAGIASLWTKSAVCVMERGGGLYPSDLGTTTINIYEEQDGKKVFLGTCTVTVPE